MPVRLLQETANPRRRTGAGRPPRAARPLPGGRGGNGAERPLRDTVERAALDVFQHQWRIYRKVVDQNYLFHREAYGRLREILLGEIDRPFRFLDIACGDASAAVDALMGTRVSRYHGIDQSEAALALARATLAVLPCPVALEHRDFVDALADRPAADVAWIGLSLHHLLAPAKLAVLRSLREVVGEDGQLMIYEPTSPDGEDREGWLHRWDQQRPWWTEYSDDEWATIAAHVWAADFPETVSVWRDLGHAAGFATVREEFVAPSNLFRLYRFQA